jgi:hypothetical protein
MERGGGFLAALFRKTVAREESVFAEVPWFQTLLNKAAGTRP